MGWEGSHLPNMKPTFENDLTTASTLNSVERIAGHPAERLVPNRCLALLTLVLTALRRNTGQGVDHLTGNVESYLLGIAEFGYLSRCRRGRRGSAPGRGDRGECGDRGPSDPERVCWWGQRFQFLRCIRELTRVVL